MINQIAVRVESTKFIGGSGSHDIIFPYQP